MRIFSHSYYPYRRDIYIIQYAINCLYKRKIDVVFEKASEGIFAKEIVIPEKIISFCFESDSEKERLMKDCISRYGIPDEISSPVVTRKRRIQTSEVYKDKKTGKYHNLPPIDLKKLGSDYYFEEKFTLIKEGKNKLNVC